MNDRRSLRQLLQVAVLAVLGWTSLCRLALAADEGGGTTSWAISYSIVLLAIILGMLVVLNSSRRRDRAGPQKYVEKNILKED